MVLKENRPSLEVETGNEGGIPIHEQIQRAYHYYNKRATLHHTTSYDEAATKRRKVTVEG